MSKILGLSAFYHDSAACLVVDGEIVAAAQEERFSRKKHDHRFPAHAVRYCLSEAGLTVDDLDIVGFYDKPLLKFDRLLETYLDYAPRGFISFLKAMPLWMKEKLWMPDLIRHEMALSEGAEDDRAAKRRGREYRFEILFGDHHESHAASAFYPSPFEEAAVLTIDGVGEWATSSIGRGRGSDLEMLLEQRFPHSLGLLYSAFTYYTGFKVNSGEYKVMGLAPYGEPKFVEAIKRDLLRLSEDGSVWLDQRYFGYCEGLRMTNRRFAELLGAPERQPETRLAQREMDLAKSLQVVTEEAMLGMARHAHQVTGSKRLCLAGGVALNCVANGRILREGPFDEVFVQPAAGDAGGAVGVALAIWHRHLGQPRTSAESSGTWAPRGGEATGGLRPYADAMKGSYLGPRDSDEAIVAWLDEKQLPYRSYPRDVAPSAAGAGERERTLAEVIAGHLAAEKVVGLHQGRMEFGPRALGGRSILGDPRSPKMQSVMNLKIKFRESFRPFAPAVLRDDVAEWFELDSESPYMLLVADVVAPRRRTMTAEEEQLWGIEKLNVVRSEIPAVTHVDYSARLQTVRRDTNPLYYDIIAAFKALTGCPVVVNTSFNVRGEPIVCTPEDSYRCFMRTEMDVLVLESAILEKGEQPAFADASNWRDEFQLD